MHSNFKQHRRQLITECYSNEINNVSVLLLARAVDDADCISAEG